MAQELEQPYTNQSSRVLGQDTEAHIAPGPSMSVIVCTPVMWKTGVKFHIVMLSQFLNHFSRLEEYFSNVPVADYFRPVHQACPRAVLSAINNQQQLLYCLHSALAG